MKHIAFLGVLALAGCTATENLKVTDVLTRSVEAVTRATVGVVAGGATMVGNAIGIEREDPAEERSDNLHDLCVGWANLGDDRFCSLMVADFNPDGSLSTRQHRACAGVLDEGVDRALCPEAPGKP